MKCYTDAAVKGNPGPAGIGFILQTETDYVQSVIPLDNEWTNHEAEFEAVIHALKAIKQSYPEEKILLLFTDSKIVAESIRKRYAKDELFMKYTTKISEELKTFEFAEVTWIPEARNKGADNLARQALQKAIK